MFRILSAYRNFYCVSQKLVKANYATIVKMPSLSPTMEEGGIVKWYKKEGDQVDQGDLLCDIQTDKAVVGLEAEDDGILAKILKPENTQNLKVGVPIGILAEEGEDWKSIEVPETAEAEDVTEAPAGKKDEKVSEAKMPSVSNEKMGPAVRRLLETYNVHTDKVERTGPGGILLKDDLQKYIESNKLQPAEQKVELVKTDVQTDSDSSRSVSRQPYSATKAPYIDIPLTSMRQTIAKRMVASKSNTPHSYTTGKANLDALITLRKSLKKNGTIASVNDFIIKACSYALRMVPDVNCTVSESSSGINIVHNSNVDVSIAVATDSGLITPIVFAADKMPVVSIGNTVRELAAKARDNKLQPHEFMGGTFTISNLGMFDIKEFTAIINAPQVAILAVGSGISELDEVPETGKLTQKTVMRFTLSTDARVVSPDTASLFLYHVSTYLENPTMLIGGGNIDSSSLDASWGY